MNVGTVGVEKHQEDIKEGKAWCSLYIDTGSHEREKTFQVGKCTLFMGHTVS